jgi:hypothetical protein
MGGTDDLDNLVALTPEEHFVAHQLLIKMYPDEAKLIYAARMMCVGGKKHVRNNKQYGWIKEMYSKTRASRPKMKYKIVNQRKPRAKETKPRKKRTLSEEHRKKIGESRKGLKHTSETIEKIRQTNILTKSKKT